MMEVSECIFGISLSLNIVFVSILLALLINRIITNRYERQRKIDSLSNSISRLDDKVSMMNLEIGGIEDTILSLQDDLETVEAKANVAYQKLTTSGMIPVDKISTGVIHSDTLGDYVLLKGEEKYEDCSV